MALTPKSILVPTDFSPASDCALGLARELAGPFKAEIHLLHVGIVVDDPIVNPEDLDEVERILAMSDARTRQALDKCAKAIDAPTHCHVKRRVASADAIIEGISEYRCDLVVMGTHGRRGLKSVLMGSVAKEIVQRSPVPVLTTRAEAGPAFPPKKILVGYDSSEDSQQAVLLAAEWASLLSAKITLLHALEPVTYPDFYALPAVSEGHLIPTSQQCHEALAKVANKYLAGVPHETAVIRARAADGITKYAAKHGFHLVVLATRGISGITHVLFGSVAERVTQLSNVPVLSARRSPQTPAPEPKKTKKTAKRAIQSPRRDNSVSVERSPNMTVVRLHERESLAGADLGLLNGWWSLWEAERRDPKAVVVILAPPKLLSRRSLERLLGRSSDTNHLSATEIGERIIREENLIQRFVKCVRELDSFVVGAVGGEVALPLAGAFLACDYRIVGSDTTIVNTTQALPRAPLGCLPWLLAKMVGWAQASKILLDVPRLPADDLRELGLANHVTAPNRLHEEALEVAERLGSLPRATLVSLKRAIIASNDGFRAYLQRETALTAQLASPHWAEQ